MATETYSDAKRTLFGWHKRPIQRAKETYSDAKRRLLQTTHEAHLLVGHGLVAPPVGHGRAHLLGGELRVVRRQSEKCQKYPMSVNSTPY
jgi:hypothetical protein